MRQTAQGRAIDGGEVDDDTQPPPAAAEGDADEYEEGPWYFGKAREEFNKRKKGGQNVDRVRQDDDDPVQVRVFDTLSRPLC